MRLGQPGLVGRAAIGLTMWLVIIAFSPVILLVGEPVNRYVMKRLRWSPPIAEVIVARTGDRSIRVVTPVRLSSASSLFLIVIHHPLWIALTAPGRWVVDKFSTPPALGTGQPGTTI